MKRVSKILWTVIVLVIIGFVASSYHADIPAQKIIEKYAYENSQFLELDGMKVHYRINGDTGKTIVLLHGTAASLHTWEGWTTELSNSYRVVSFDLPGFGLTGPEPNNDYSRERYVKFIHDVLQKLNIDSCYMAGNSFGGYLAWSYAVAYPNEVRKLALLDASGYPRNNSSMPISFRLQKTEWLKPIITRITPRSLVEKSVKVVYYDDSKVTEELVQRYYDLLLREGNRGGLMGKSIQINYDYAQEIKQITCPTLIMWGDTDMLVNVESAPRFHADIPNSELIIYKNMGHIPMEEIPEKSATDFMVFLEK